MEISRLAVTVRGIKRREVTMNWQKCIKYEEQSNLFFKLLTRQTACILRMLFSEDAVLYRPENNNCFDFVLH